MSVKTILVSQPKPSSEKSPYFDLAEKYKLKIDFRPFINVVGVTAREFRAQKIDLGLHSAVILTSKTSVDNFFRIAEETRYKVPESMKYFCISEAIAYYLQKYVVYRKRKIFFGKQNIYDLVDVLKKHKDERFLLPCSDILRQNIPDTLNEKMAAFKKDGTLIRTPWEIFGNDSWLAMYDGFNYRPESYNSSINKFSNEFLTKQLTQMRDGIKTTVDNTQTHGDFLRQHCGFRG